jgi:Mrp family chromosome partitioning ATPase
VDGDLRQPRVHELLELPLSPGLSEALQGEPVRATATGRGGESLRALPAGAAVTDPPAVLSRGLRDVLFAAARPDEVVIVPTPLADAFADAVAITAACDAAVLVVNMRTTPRRAVGRVSERLRLVRGNVAGAYLTDGHARPA